MICCYLLDFSRSDLSFMPVIERQPKCGIPMKTIMVALLRLRSATDIANHRTKPKILAPYGQKSFKIESNRSNRVLCLICCYLLDFSRSDSFSAMNFRLLSVAEASKCRIQIFHILAFVETSYHAVSENHSSFISSDSHCATLFSIYPAMPFISSQSRIIRS